MQNEKGKRERGGQTRRWGTGAGEKQHVTNRLSDSEKLMRKKREEEIKTRVVDGSRGCDEQMFFFCSSQRSPASDGCMHQPPEKRNNLQISQQRITAAAYEQSSVSRARHV